MTRIEAKTAANHTVYQLWRDEQLALGPGEVD